MLKRMALAALLVLLPTVARAQAAEELLPARSQIYLRFDGMKAHQAAFGKTAAGQMLQGDTGTFLVELWKYAQELLQLLARNEPQAGPWLADATGLVRDFYQNGLVLGVHAEAVMPPSARAVVVFPKAAGERGTLLPLIQKITEATQAEVKDVKVGARFVHQTRTPFVSVGWWAQGEDVVVYVGTDEPAEYARGADAKKTGLADHPLYARVRDFKDFPTCSRGYVDLQGLVKLAGTAHPAAAGVVKDLGFDGLGSLTFVSGFDGAAQRAVTELETAGPRQGLLSMVGTKKLRLKDLPPLPADLTGFSASSMAFDKSYDAIMQAVEGVMKVAAPDQVDNVKESIKAVEGVLGVQLKDDLFGAFGDVYVGYGSASEGLLGLGSVSVFQVKDGKKLAATLDKLVKAVPALPGFELSWKTRDYKGGQILELTAKFNEFSNTLGSFGFYKDWLIYSPYPQAVKGFILRGNGELPAWKADDRLTKELARFPEEFTAISISDPRPTVRTALALLPVLFNMSNSFIGQALPGARPFDLALIPHAEEATQHLFPNITVSTDDGKRVRSETRASVTFP